MRVVQSVAIFLFCQVMLRTQRAMPGRREFINGDYLKKKTNQKKWAGKKNRPSLELK